MCIRDRFLGMPIPANAIFFASLGLILKLGTKQSIVPVSYTHLRAHETPEHLVCRLLISTRVRSSAASDVYKRQVSGNADSGQCHFFCIAWINSGTRNQAKYC